VAADRAHYDVMDVLLKHGAKVSNMLGHSFSVQGLLCMRFNS